VIVSSVVKGGPAAKAGIQGVVETRRGIAVGDVIVGLDGKPVRSYDDLYTALDGRSPGETVEVSLRRDDKVIKKRLKLVSLK
jgi:S1-C subfamily serine protease